MFGVKDEGTNQKSKTLLTISMWAYSDKEYVIIECAKHFHREIVFTTKGVLTYEQFYIVKFRDFIADFCETLISISKLRLSRETLVSFSFSILNFDVRNLILNSLELAISQKAGIAWPV